MASLLLLLLLTLVSGGLAVMQPWPIQWLVDYVLGSAALPPGVANLLRSFSVEPTRMGMLGGVVAMSLTLFIFSSLVNAALTLLKTQVERLTTFEAGCAAFARLQRRSVLFHKRAEVGELIHRVLNDSATVFQMIERLLIEPMGSALKIGLMAYLIARFDGKLALIALGLAPVAATASFLMGKPLRAVAQLKREIEGRVKAFVYQTMTGVPVVQAFSQEQRESVRFRQLADEHIRSQRRSAVLDSYSDLLTGSIGTLGTAVILWLAARQVIDGTLSLGNGILLVIYYNSLQVQSNVFANYYPTFLSLNSSLQRLVEVLETPIEIADPPNPRPLTSVRGEVRFENLTTGYEPGHPIVRGVSLQVSPEEMVAIVGPTGAGKSTLVNLVPRFYDPWEGRVLIDGFDIRQAELKAVREQVAVVTQETFLFPRTVAENIGYGRPSATFAEIEEAARSAGAHEFIMDLPQNYETVIGERGSTLSGGMRQRLAIARAFLKNAPILILDEPTSALDSEAENLVLKSLQRLIKGRTTLIIAHRLPTIRQASKIVVMSEGAIAECGQHRDLLARSEYYRRWCALHAANRSGTSLVAD